MSKKEQSMKDFLAHYPSPEEILRDYLSNLGKKGGSAKSEKKSRAVKANGKLGGRPKKIKPLCKRLEKFRSMEEHAYYRKYYKKLSPSDIKFIEEFILANQDLARDEFEMKANRLFLDNPNKPKNWVALLEFLTSANIPL